MLPEPIALPPDCFDALRTEAALRDADGAFPRASFTSLHRHGLLAAPPIGPAQSGQLLRLLAGVGYGDLSVGRIYEGHVNALLLIHTHGTEPQRREAGRIVEAGGVFGVWNTDAPGAPLALQDGVLTGRKIFASGVDGLSHAIVTVPTDGGRQMILCPVADLAVDRSWWRPMGMRASGSHDADFTGVAIGPGWLLGEGDAYIAEPWFSAGAMRFAAVQIGGIHAVVDTAVRHLRDTGRAADPYQRQRLGRMGIALHNAYAWIDTASSAWTMAASQLAQDTAARAIAAANGMRFAVEAAAFAVLEDAERSVGAAGFIAPHPLERQMRDLRTYLRQPNPDGALAAFGTAIADGHWLAGHKNATVEDVA